MKKLPIGIQSIREILEEDQVYIDKTGLAKKLIESGKHYFMSRPRRFGKSLFLSTLEEIFRGNKEIFKKCQIYASDYGWQEYPTLCLDFSKIASSTPEQLERALKVRLEIIGEEHDISILTQDVQVALDTLVTRLSNKYKSKVVTLVDEYDSPIINSLKRPEVAEQNRDLLKAFFGTLKSLDKYLKFTFVTGVSKFSQVSLFSGPNNLTDITMDPSYAAMMGYTEEELEASFSSHVEAITKKRKTSQENILEEIRTWYNGYRFSEKELSVYNPYSTLRYLNATKAESYWYSTGTPSFLIDEVKKRPEIILPLRGSSALKSTLSDISRVDRIHLAALMFQTGYLTIRDYNMEENSYELDFPNKEVKEAFFNSLLQEFTEVDPLQVSRAASALQKDLENFELESFVATMNTHFAKIAYRVFSHAGEGFYQAVFFTFLEKSGIQVYSEMPTNIGQVDLVSEMAEVVYIFELKLDRAADIALSQIEAKKYAERYSQDGKSILVMGISFHSRSRNIGYWKALLYSPTGEKIKEIMPTA